MPSVGHELPSRDALSPIGLFYGDLFRFFALTATLSGCEYNTCLISYDRPPFKLPSKYLRLRSCTHPFSFAQLAAPPLTAPAFRMSSDSFSPPPSLPAVNEVALPRPRVGTPAHSSPPFTDRYLLSLLNFSPPFFMRWSSQHAFSP